MKKNRAIRYALIFAGLLSLTGCKEEEKQASVPSKKEVKIEQASRIQKTPLDETYDEILKYYSGSSLYLKKGFFENKKCVKIGAGVPMTLDEFKSLPFRKDLESDLYLEKNADSFYQNTLINGDEIRIGTHLVRPYVKQKLKKLENSKYRSLCSQYKMDYDKLPAKARASIFCIDMATGGKISSYTNFLKAVSRHDWNTALEQSYVSTKTYFKANPNVAKDSGVNFNRNMKVLFNELIKEKQILQQKLSGKTR